MSEELKAVLNEIRSDLTNLERAALFVAQVLGDARYKEIVVKDELALAQIELAKAEASALELAYRTGTIDGKNAETRKAQTDNLLSTDPVIRTRVEQVSKLNVAVVVAKVESQYYQDVLNVLMEAIKR